MKVGVILPMAEGDGHATTPGWPAIRSFAEAAEERGLDSVWVFDHYFYEPPDGPIEGVHESWTVLSAVAAVTRRIELGTLVLCAGFRDPGLVAKMAATADEVSGGRLILGLGAGWHDPEYRAFGIPIEHRVDRFEETLRIVRPLLEGERVTFDGAFHRTHEAVLVPPPSRRIPILVAAKGPRMLRLTAREADAWNTAWYGAPDDRLHGRLADLDAALAEVGRDPSEVKRTIGVLLAGPESSSEEDGAFTGTPDEVARWLDAYEVLGADHLIVSLDPITEPSLDRLAAAVALRAGTR